MPEYNLSRSKEAYDQSCSVFPGGVNSPVRALGSVGGTPFFASHGHGAEIQDVDGNSYIDMVLAYGPLLLGHAHLRVVEALHEAVENGWSYGAPTTLETELARRVQSFYPSMEKMRFVNSGTEATMTALRLARGFTSRDLTLKFEGCYHGHVDSLLVKAGSGALTHGHPNSGGVPEQIASTTLLARFNDIEQVQNIFAKYGDRIAAVIVEPVAGNMGVVTPEIGFLTGLRSITRERGSLLIFDEVMTGFRVSAGGAQARYGVRPDITCLGKVIGGGLPVGAFGASAAIMSHLAPEGEVYQAGTLSGNPLAMSAGIATLTVLANQNPFEVVEKRASDLARAIEEEAAAANINLCVQQVGSMLTPFFNRSSVKNLDEAQACDTEMFTRFYHAMRAAGVSIPPSQFESWFLSTAHDGSICERIVAATRIAFQEISKES